MTTTTRQIDFEKIIKLIATQHFSLKDRSNRTITERINGYNERIQHLINAGKSMGHNIHVRNQLYRLLSCFTLNGTTDFGITNPLAAVSSFLTAMKNEIQSTYRLNLDEDQKNLWKV